MAKCRFTRLDLVVGCIINQSKFHVKLYSEIANLCHILHSWFIHSFPLWIKPSCKYDHSEFTHTVGGVNLYGNICHVDPLMCTMETAMYLLLSTAVKILHINTLCQCGGLKNKILNLSMCFEYLCFLVDTFSDDPGTFKHVITWSKSSTHFIL